MMARISSKPGMNSIKWIIGFLLSAGLVLFQSSVSAGTWSQSTEQEFALNSRSEVVVRSPGDASISDTVYSTEHSADADTVLLMHFDEEAWSGTTDEVIDSSGRENHGTANGGVTTTARGKFGRAGEFDGVDDSVNVSDDASLDPGSGPWTAEAWLYLTETTAPAYIPFHKGSDVGDNENWRMQIQGASGGNVALFCWASGSRQYDQVHSVAIPRKQWVHVAFTFDGTDNRYALYINGRRSNVRLDVDQHVGAIETPESLLVGNSQKGRYPFKGTIDEVRISNIVRYTSDFIPDSLPASGTMTSLTINSGEPVIDIRLDREETLPEGSSITYSTTNDGGAHWHKLPGNNKLFTFPKAGNDLRVKAELRRGRGGSPILRNWKAEFAADPSYSAITGQTLIGTQVTLHTPDGSIYSGTPQDNPQITDVSGRLEFYAEKGKYYITATLRRHEDYTSPVFTLGEDPVVANAKMERAKRVKPYRVIFNCDGYNVFAIGAGNVDAWVKNMFGPLFGSQVEAFFWCDGAGGNTANYDSDVLERTGARAGYPDGVLLRWIKEGNDPPKVVVREGHKRGLDVFYSLRFNDIHDGHMPEELATFKEEHPEWMLGDQFNEFPTSLNFAVPEVRDIRLRTIEELFDKYDFDGIEIDFMRSPRYFPTWLEYRYATIMTDLLRTVRQRLDEQAEQRGRPIKIAVRVDENLTACRLNGFDVAAWINEGLIDILIIGDMAFPEGEDIRAFKELAQGKPVEIYVCVAHPSKSIEGISFLRGDASALLRGLAANYWQQGVDGVYTFNWFPGGAAGVHPDLLSYQIPLLKEIGDPKMLLAKDKVFPAGCSGHGPGRRDHPSSPRFHNWMFASLPVTLHPVWNANSFTVIPVDVADDLSGAIAEKVKSLQLWVELHNVVPGDVVDFRLNGQPLGPMPGPAGGGLIRFTLRPDQVKVGRNEVGIRLNKRGAQGGDDIIASGVEIRVDYE